MKHLVLFSFFFVAAKVTCQEGRFSLQKEDGSLMRKLDYADYGTHQLFCGFVMQPDHFWFAKTSGESLQWMKYIEPHPSWNLDDPMSMQIAQCKNSTDVILVAKGNDQSNYTAHVYKVNENGELLWTREVYTELNTFSSQTRDSRPIIMQDDGFIFTMWGEHHLQVTKISFGGDLVFSKKIEVTGTATTNNYAVSFFEISDGYMCIMRSETSPFIIKLDEEMNVVWAKKLNAGVSGGGGAVLETETGEYLISGFHNINSSFVAALDANGELLHYYLLSDEFTLSGSSQLLPLSDTTFLINNDGYTILDFGTFTYEHIHPTEPNFSGIKIADSDSSYSLSLPFDTYYYLDLNLREPTCFQYEQTAGTIIEADNVVLTAGSCTVTDLGSVEVASFAVYNTSGSVVKNCMLGASEEETLSLRVYPNPAKASQWLEFSGVSFADYAAVCVSDAKGTIVAEIPFDNQVMLPASLTAGLYFITIVEKGGLSRFTQRIVLE